VASSEDTENPDVIADYEEAEQLPRERRTRVLKKGKVIFDGGLRSAPVVVRDLSSGGARLKFEQAYLLPKQFTLHIELEDFEVECERRWEDGLDVGVAFIGDKKQIKKERVQVLNTSDAALLDKVDEKRVALDGYYQRTHKPDAGKPRDPVPRPSTGRRTFGKRR